MLEMIPNAEEMKTLRDNCVGFMIILGKDERLKFETDSKIIQKKFRKSICTAPLQCHCATSSISRDGSKSIIRCVSISIITVP